MYWLSSILSLCVCFFFGLAMALYPANFLEHYNVKLDLAKPGSADALTAYFIRSLGIALTGFGCLFLYALSYRLHKFSAALLRVHAVMRFALAYNMFEVILPWGVATNLPSRPLHIQIAVHAGLGLISLLGSFTVPADKSSSKKSA